MELLLQGHLATCVALNDPCIEQEVSTSLPLSAGALSLLRLPSAWSAIKRFRKARHWLAHFDPSWVSLQFVPYAFHAKGLPLFLLKHLHGIIQGRQVHLMVHESWIGAETGSSVKHRLLSVLQKAIIIRIIKGIHPAVIHTHLPFYSTHIAQLGWRVLPLPLFSNIPVVKRSNNMANAIFRVGIFSQADTSRPFLDFLIRLEESLALCNQVLQILLIGGNASKMRTLGDFIEEVDSLRNKVHYTGFLEPAQISEALQSCSLGLTPVPRHALGKSGSVAAFLSHGIPVAAPNVHNGYSANDIGFFSPNLCSFILLEPDLEHFRIITASLPEESEIKISTVAQAFLRDLYTQTI
ncbi:glycosyltransferase [Hymenobacter sp. UV11]|nr:glycosyltransferase [Hymenobacter sp. UV11]